MITLGSSIGRPRGKAGGGEDHGAKIVGESQWGAKGGTCSREWEIRSQERGHGSLIVSRCTCALA